VEIGGQRPAEDLRGDVGLGRAAGVAEQAGVVGLRCARSVDAQPVGQAHGDQRRVQAVLEREGHAEVGRQASAAISSAVRTGSLPCVQLACCATVPRPIIAADCQGAAV
jgi:hypothetical protein